MRTTWRIVASLLLALTALATHAAERDRPAITVFAAVSLTNALQEAGAAFTHATSVPVKFSVEAVAQLGRQIESGARERRLHLTDQEWMDYLQARGLIDRASRRDLVGNRLMLVAPVDSTLQLKIAPRFALLAALGAGRLATGDPDSVPVGKYARSALISLGVWNEVQDRLIRAENVRSALAFVARGEAPLGIVYATDAQAEPRVRVVATFPARTHPRIVYPAARVRAADPGRSAGFLAHMRGREAQRAFARAGFAAP